MLDIRRIRDSIRNMDGEKEANMENISGSPQRVPEEVRNVAAELGEREAEIELLEYEEKQYVFADADLNSLSEEQLKAHVELLDEQIEQAKKRIETNRRAVNIGLLKKANRAPRCSRLKKNGEPCRAPAVKGESLCYYHLSAAETRRDPEMQIDVLEDRAEPRTSIDDGVAALALAEAATTSWREKRIVEL